MQPVRASAGAVAQLLVRHAVGRRRGLWSANF